MSEVIIILQTKKIFVRNHIIAHQQNKNLGCENPNA